MAHNYATAADLRMKTNEELNEFVRAKEDEILKLKFQKAMGQLENIRRLTVVKKELARARTIGSEKAQAKAE